MWTYQQSTGKLSNGSGLTGVGYSGRGETGLNNPAAEDLVAVGPIRRGLYKIGPWEDEHPHLGPIVAPLTPIAHDTHGRSGFFIHGDNAEMNHTASDGCIILNRLLRLAMRSSGDSELMVVE